MSPLDPTQIAAFLERHIEAFHDARLRSLSEIRLITILRRKNPYLYRAKNVLIAEDMVRGLLDAHLSSQEETLFGAVLEALAIHVAGETSGGRKSSSEGIDLEFVRDGTFHLVSIKSGPNWGNASQTARMVTNFNRAKKILATNNPGVHVVAVNGCCYGRDRSPDKELGYRKLCGQAFWEYLSGDADFYTKIVEPLGYRAQERNERFTSAYAQVVNRFTEEFSRDFCRDGIIDWFALVRLNSSRDRPETTQSGVSI